MMDIVKATPKDIETIQTIVHSTIEKIYPRYYPVGAVAFFLKHHARENIAQAIANGEVYLLFVEGMLVGTGSIKENEIGRLFILPEYQGKGYGTQAMDAFEQMIAKQYDMITLDASLPAYSMYVKRGYHPVAYHKIRTDNGDYLCYHVLTRTIKG